MLTMVTALYGLDTMDPEMAYHLIKWQIENQDLYKHKTETGPYMNKELLTWTLDNTTVPIHDGTIKYVKEIGEWTKARADRHKFNLWLLRQFKEAYEAAIEKADEQKIKVVTTNADWLALWEKYAKEVHKLPIYKARNDKEIQEMIQKNNIQ